jgi:hypothetical protein
LQLYQQLNTNRIENTSSIISSTVDGTPTQTQTQIQTQTQTQGHIPLNIDKLSFKTMLSDMKKLQIQTITFPNLLQSKVMEIESIQLTAAMKTKIPFLRHLPEGCNIFLLELQMKKFVREDVLSRYESEFAKRATDRRNRAKVKEYQKQEDVLEK